MAETTKTKVLDIQTGKAQKNVKSLKQVIKELRDEMALLEKGTAEYDAMSKKLADAMQKQREIAEAAKYSNKDIGATLGNITTIGAGAVGAINGVSAALQLVGVEGEDAEKALKNIQLTMALIQGLSALDTALKAIKGLSVAFKGLNTQRTTNTVTTLAAAGAETAEAAALKDNTDKTYKNIDAAEKYDEAQAKNIAATEASKKALYEEAAALKVVEEARLKQYEVALREASTKRAVAQTTGDTKAAAMAYLDEIKYSEAINKTKQKINQYYQEHREERLKYHNQYYQNNKEEMIEKAKEYYNNNKNEIKEKHKQRRLTPEGKIYARVTNFNRNHPDRMIETALEAKQKYLETGYIPTYIKSDDLLYKNI